MNAARPPDPLFFSSDLVLAFMIFVFRSARSLAELEKRLSGDAPMGSRADQKKTQHPNSILHRPLLRHGSYMMDIPEFSKLGNKTPVEVKSDAGIVTVVPFRLHRGTGEKKWCLT